jgi:hypothetical protein
MNIVQEINLIRFVEANLGRPFAWGRCDCNILALEMSDTVFGTDLAGKVRGRYENRLGAIRYRLRSPWGSFIGLIREAGFVWARRGFEQTGDLLVVGDPRWEMVHICLGQNALSSFPDEGVRVFPVSSMRSTFYNVWRWPCLQ